MSQELTESCSCVPSAAVPKSAAAAKASRPMPFLRILSFFLVLALAALGLNQAITLGLKRIKTSKFGDSNALVSGKIDADIVISGSSRAVSHYDSRIIQQFTGLKTYNIGRNGSQTDMQLAVLKAYLKHNKKPRLVIHNLDSFSFVTTHEVYDPGQYLPYLSEPEIFNALRKINPAIWKSKYIPLYGYAVEDMRFTWLLGMRGLFGLSPAEDQFQGFHPGDQHWTGDFEKYRAQHRDGVRFTIEEAGARDLEELIAICRQQNISVLLVYSPVYYEMQNLERDRAELFSKFECLSKKWDAPLWDYSGSPICHDRDFFYNSQHLNAAGACRFSTELAQRLARSKAVAVSQK